MAIRNQPVDLVDAALQAFEAEQRELDATRDRTLRAVVSQRATGTGDIDDAFGLDRKYRLVFIRAHFTGNPGSAAFRISLDSNAGPEHNTTLFTVTNAGLDHDVHLRIAGADTQDPSAWTFIAADRLRIQWVNPDVGNITWGVDIGLAPAP